MVHVASCNLEVWRHGSVTSQSKPIVSSVNLRLTAGVRPEEVVVAEAGPSRSVDDASPQLASDLDASLFRQLRLQPELTREEVSI